MSIHYPWVRTPANICRQALARMPDPERERAIADATRSALTQKWSVLTKELWKKVREIRGDE